MELLNNIWIAVNTENEMLVKLLLIPASIIENILSLLLFTSLLNIKSTKKQSILYVLALSLLGLASQYLIPAPFNFFVNYIGSYIIIYKIFKLNILKSLVALISPILVFTLISTIYANVYLSIFNITSNNLNLILIYRIPYLIFLYLLIFAISMIIKYRNIYITLIEDLDKKTKNIVIMNLLLGLFTVAIQVILITYYADVLPIIISILSFISLLSYFFANIYSLNKVMNLAIKTRELESSEAYNKSLTILHDSVRGFKHDFDNIVATIGGYISINDMDGLKKYYKSLQADCQKANNLATLNPSIINNPGIYSLLSSKYHKADEKNIKINLEFFLDLNELNIDMYEFSRMLGILLDNAIEAASECEEKIINIKFMNERNKHRHIIVIENTYNNKDVNTDEIFTKGVSGKQNHTGLGLWEVRKYISKSKNLNLFTTKNDKYFIQQFEIYYNVTKKVAIK